MRIQINSKIMAIADLEAHYVFRMVFMPLSVVTQLHGSCLFSWVRVTANTNTEKQAQV